MIDTSTAGVLRLVALLGLGVSVLAWALAGSAQRKTLASVSATVALVSILIYFFGVMAAADSGLNRFLPRFP